MHRGKLQHLHKAAQIIRYSAASICSAVIDLSLFTLLAASILPSTAPGLLIATGAARILSGICNFFLNRRWVFQSRTNTKKQALYYLILFSVQLVASWLLVLALSAAYIPLAIAKILADITLFLISYQIQRWLIFK